MAKPDDTTGTTRIQDCVVTGVRVEDDFKGDFAVTEAGVLVNAGGTTGAALVRVMIEEGETDFDPDFVYVQPEGRTVELFYGDDEDGAFVTIDVADADVVCVYGNLSEHLGQVDVWIAHHDAADAALVEKEA